MLQGLRILVFAVPWLAPTSAWSVLNALLCLLLSNIFLQEDAAVVVHTKPVSLPLHPSLPLCSMLNGISPPGGWVTSIMVAKSVKKNNRALNVFYHFLKQKRCVQKVPPEETHLPSSRFPGTELVRVSLGLGKGGKAFGR